MSIINEVYAIHLSDLFGPDATVTDVEYCEGFIHFCLPVKQDADFHTVDCQISGIIDGQLLCLITETQLTDQLRLRRCARDFFKKLDEQNNEHT